MGSLARGTAEDGFMRDSYELLDGRRIPDLHRDDVREALAAFRLWSPVVSTEPPTEIELDAMARAILQARAARDRREREADRRMIRNAQSARTAIEIRRRMEQRAERCS